MKKIITLIVVTFCLGLLAQPIPFNILKKNYYDSKAMDAGELKHYEEYKAKFRKLGLKEKPDYISRMPQDEYSRMGKHAEKCAEENNYIDYFYSLKINLNSIEEFKKMGIYLDSLTMYNPFSHFENFNQVILFTPVIIKARVTKEIDRSKNLGLELRIEKIYKGKKYYSEGENVILEYEKGYSENIPNEASLEKNEILIKYDYVEPEEVMPKIGYSYIFFLDVNIDGSICMTYDRKNNIYTFPIAYKHPYIYNIYNNPMECDRGLTFGYKVPLDLIKDNETEFENLVNSIEKLNESEAKHPARKLIEVRDAK